MGAVSTYPARMERDMGEPRIESLANRLVKSLRALRTPKGRDGQRQFLAEGAWMLDEAEAAGWHPEIILVDDFSRDGTRDLLKKLADVDPTLKVFFHEVNRGKGAAIRTALAALSGQTLHRLLGGRLGAMTDASPLIDDGALVDVSAVTSKLWPGQVRDGEYLVNGTFRWSGPDEPFPEHLEQAVVEVR